MTLADRTDEPAEPQAVTVTVTLEHDAAELWNELKQRTGWDASELIGWALGAQWREMEGIVPPPPQSREDADRLVAEGEAALERGDTVGQDEMFERLRQKYGE